MAIVTTTRQLPSSLSLRAARRRHRLSYLMHCATWFRLRQGSRSHGYRRRSARVGLIPRYPFDAASRRVLVQRLQRQPPVAREFRRDLFFDRSPLCRLSDFGTYAIALLNAITGRHPQQSRTAPEVDRSDAPNPWRTWQLVRIFRHQHRSGALAAARDDTSERTRLGTAAFCTRRTCRVRRAAATAALT